MRFWYVKRQIRPNAVASEKLFQPLRLGDVSDVVCEYVRSRKRSSFGEAAKSERHTLNEKNTKWERSLRACIGEVRFTKRTRGVQSVRVHALAVQSAEKFSGSLD